MRPEIIEKIQKLLALATSSNENEAKLAASKAQELLVKYNLSMTQVDAHDSEYIREDGDLLKRASKKDSFINIILKKYFFVDIVKSQRRHLGTTIVTMGKKHNVEIASFVRTFLSRAFDEAFAAYRKETGETVKARESFYFGLYNGIMDQLEATKTKVEQQVGLVVVSDKGLVDFSANQFKNLKSRKMAVSTNSAAALDAGKEAGLNMRIGRGLGSPSVNNGKFLK